MSHKTKLQKLRQRRDMKVWYPRASDLVLPDVPASERGQVRKILEWLGKFPIRGGTCWQTAQAVTLTAGDPRVQYCEGVSWNVKRIAGRCVPMFPHDGECTSSICVCKPLPHAWNTCNGHIVDLQGEFYNWRFPGSEYLHESLKVYSPEDIPVGGVSGSILQKVWMDEHEDRKPESMAAICQHVFKEASDRLVRDVGDMMDKNLPKQSNATAEDLGDGLFRVTDSKVLAALPCRQLGAHEEFQSYRQLSQGPPDHKNKRGRTRGRVSQVEVPSPSVPR